MKSGNPIHYRSRQHARRLAAHADNQAFPEINSLPALLLEQERNRQSVQNIRTYLKPQREENEMTT